ncbi:MAG: helix-turn-helix transcriptional regulator [Desulfuromusa sp.]
MNPFTNNFKSDKPSGRIEIPLTIPVLEEFTHEPVTLGDHLRQRRIELGLYQKDVAAKLGVTTSTVWNWEYGWAIGNDLSPEFFCF